MITGLGERGCGRESANDSTGSKIDRRVNVGESAYLLWKEILSLRQCRNPFVQVFRTCNGDGLFLFVKMMISEKLSNLASCFRHLPVLQGLYKPVMLDQNLLYFSGHLPLQDDGTLITGKVGA